MAAPKSVLGMSSEKMQAVSASSRDSIDTANHICPKFRFLKLYQGWSSWSAGNSANTAQGSLLMAVPASLMLGAASAY